MEKTDLSKNFQKSLRKLSMYCHLFERITRVLLIHETSGSLDISKSVEIQTGNGTGKKKRKEKEREKRGENSIRFENYETYLRKRNAT